MTRPRAADVEPVVLSRTPVGDDLVVLELGSADGSPLPAWTNEAVPGHCLS